MHLPSAWAHASATAADELPKLYHFLLVFFLNFLMTLHALWNGQWWMRVFRNPLHSCSSSSSLRLIVSHRTSKMYHFEWLDIQLKSMACSTNRTRRFMSIKREKSFSLYRQRIVLLIWMRSSEEQPLMLCARTTSIMLSKVLCVEMPHVYGPHAINYLCIHTHFHLHDHHRCLFAYLSSRRRRQHQNW